MRAHEHERLCIPPRVEHRLKGGGGSDDAAHAATVADGVQQLGLCGSIALQSRGGHWGG